MTDQTTNEIKTAINNAVAAAEGRDYAGRIKSAALLLAHHPHDETAYYLADHLVKVIWERGLPARGTANADWRKARGAARYLAIQISGMRDSADEDVEECARIHARRVISAIYDA